VDGPKNGTIFVCLNFIKYQPIFEIASTCNNTFTKNPTTPSVDTLHCEMSNFLKATTENNTSVHFKKLTTGNSAFSVSVIV